MATSSAEAIAGGRARRGLTGLLLRNVFLTLALALGVMQALVLHGVWVALAQRPSPGAGFWLALAAGLVMLSAALYRPLRAMRRRADAVGALARGYMSLGVGTLLLGMVILVLWILRPLAAALLGATGLATETVTQTLHIAGVSIALLALTAIVWGATFGQARVQRSRVRVPVAGLDPQLAGLRIVQISDLHIGNRMEGRRLARLVERVNALAPDLVAMTGDLFDFDPDHVEAGARELAGLRARYGVFAVLGNHDHYTGSETVARALARHAPGIRLLRGELEALPLAAPLHVAGVDDPGRLWTEGELHLEGLERLAERLPAEGPTILLVHRPDAFPQAERLGFSLVLSGHTHGGQIALPGLARRINLARIISRYPHGLYRRGQAHLYVNRGAGVAGPAIRIGAPREITTLVLHPS